MKNAGLFSPDRNFQAAALLLAAAAFALYAASSAVLQARSASFLFGADTYLYASIAVGKSFDRIARFHPFTVALAEGWMFLHKPFAAWIGPHEWLKTLFAMAGAAGVWVVSAVLAKLVARPLALLGAMIYALSLSVWYFSSIEEAKIVGATLSALYILLWQKLRETWSPGTAFLLTLVLLAACLNEIVAGFLVCIPFVDEWLRGRLDARKLRWIAVHAFAAPLALLILETLPERLAAVHDIEGKSHFSMLFYYIARNDFSPVGLYSFLLNWLPFSMAAPETKLVFCKGCWAYFEPHFTQYFAKPWTAAPLILLCAMLAAIAIPRFRPSLSSGTAALLLALAAYSGLRGAFYFLFNSSEAMLYTAPVMAAHVILFIVLFASAGLPAKHTALGLLALLLFIANGLFMLGV